MKHYSKQREAILEVLRETDTHPTANWIYEKVREKIPNISLGTVYRNLSGLTADGEILQIDVGDGFEHYDGDISPHLHLYCKECEKIFDTRLKTDYIRNIAKKDGFLTDTTIYVAHGICKNCNKNLI
jgi:Fe2+ or Zn2+ uptake regulation protein